MTEKNNNIDLQQQIKSGEINIEDIKKLFEKIPKKYLDDLSIDKDNDFDDDDIQKIISGDFDKNSAFGKELLAKKDKITINYLKQIIEQVNNRISSREQQENRGKIIKQANLKTLNINKEKLNSLKNKKIQHNHFDFKTQENLKGKEIKDKAEFIEYRIENKNQKVKQTIENIEKNQGIIDQINTNISIINSYLDFLSNNDFTKTDKEYEILYKELKEKINKLTKKINELSKEILKSEKEIEKIVLLEKEYSKLIEKFNEIINNKNSDNDENNPINYVTRKLFLTKELMKKNSKKLGELVNENINGINEFFHLAQSIEKKASLFPNDNRVKLLLKKSKEINNNKEINIIEKRKILKNISKELGEHVKNLILNEAKSIYKKYETYFPIYKKEIYNSTIKYMENISKSIKDHGGISYAELNNLKLSGEYLYKLSPIIQEIEENFKGINNKEKENLIKSSKYYLEEIINNFNAGKKVDLSDFKEFIKNEINKTPILERIKDKEISKMTIKEAEEALKYLNEKYNNYKESFFSSADKALEIFSSTNNIEDIDTKTEANIFQEKLIEKILKSNGGKKEGGIGFDKNGNLWGFDSKKGNYLINVGHFIQKVNQKGIENINSKALASFLAYFDNLNILSGPMLYDILGEKNFKKLQELWKNKENSITKTLLKNINLDDTIKMIKSFDIKKYNKKLESLKNSKNPGESLKKTIEEMNNKIQKAPTKEQDIILKRLKHGLQFNLGENQTNFDNINIQDLKNLKNLNPKFKEIIQEKITAKIENERKKRTQEKINKIKSQILKMFEKRLGNIPDFQDLKNLINDTNLIDKTGKINKTKIIILKNKIKKIINKYNEKNPDKKKRIPAELINNISLKFLNLAEYSIVENMEEINQKLKEIIDELTKLKEAKKETEKVIKKLEKEIKEAEEEIKKEAQKANLSIEDFLKTKEGQELAKKLKYLKESKEGVKKGKEDIEKQIEEKEKKFNKTSKQGISLAKSKEKIEIEILFTQEANKKGLTPEKFKKTPEGKKIYKQIEQQVKQKTIETVQRYEAVASGDPENAKIALEELQKENKKQKEELEKKLFNYTKDKQKKNKKGETKIVTSNKNKEESLIKDYTFNSETGVINTKSGENIKLDPDEKKLASQNPETLKNMVNFYETLDRLGLKKLWTIRKQIFKSIENVVGIGFNIDGDYLNENEIKIFLNSILKSIGEQEISPVFNLNSFLNKIEVINKNQIGGGEKIVNNYYSETYLENKFFEKFVGRNNTIIGFKQSEFEKSIK